MTKATIIAPTRSIQRYVSENTNAKISPKLTKTVNNFTEPLLSDLKTTKLRKKITMKESPNSTHISGFWKLALKPSPL